ncbi:unnamed protein product, partial [Discosporangium mesarthrocarpum]
MFMGEEPAVVRLTGDKAFGEELARAEREEAPVVPELKPPPTLLHPWRPGHASGSGGGRAEGGGAGFDEGSKASLAMVGER